MPHLVDLTASRPDAPTSAVTATPPADPAEARAHFGAKLALETDPADLHVDLAGGVGGIVVLDSRSSEAYRRSHIPGAISLPLREIDAESTRELNGHQVVVTYCWGPGCNSAAKAALRLANLGLPVKELIGGIEYWRRDGYPLVSGDEPGSLESGAA